MCVCRERDKESVSVCRQRECVWCRERDKESEVCVERESGCVCVER